jgi:hypothetical protein
MRHWINCPFEDVALYTETQVRELLAAERQRWEEALRLTWRMVDPLNPAGEPGSYARGQDNGIVAALTTLRANLKTPNVALSRHARQEHGDDR